MDTMTVWEAGLPGNHGGPTAVERRSTKPRARRLARYEQVVALREPGTSTLGIAIAR